MPFHCHHHCIVSSMQTELAAPSGPATHITPNSMEASNHQPLGALSTRGEPGPGSVLAEFGPFSFHLTSTLLTPSLPRALGSVSLNEPTLSVSLRSSLQDERGFALGFVGSVPPQGCCLGQKDTGGLGVPSIPRFGCFPAFPGSPLQHPTLPGGCHGRTHPPARCPRPCSRWSFPALLLCLCALSLRLFA